MIRTSLSLPPTLHQRLVLGAKYNKAAVSDYMRHLIDEALVLEEEARTKEMYQDLQDLSGIGPQGVTDVSMTIDDTLYGEHGAWQGE